MVFKVLTRRGTMNFYSTVVVIMLVASSLSSAIPRKEGDHTNRVLDKGLSDEEHYKDGEHNADYDHESFLGEEESKKFDELTPEESLERLGKIIDKIDKNKDSHITEQELIDWIGYVQRRYIVTDTERQWKDHNIKDDKISWDDYKKNAYGFMEDGDDDEDDMSTYKQMIVRDERRWKVADENNDGALDKDEFANFLHPEEANHMRDIVVEETLEDIDKDNDGFIDIDEYIGDMWPNKDEEDEPEWVKKEREQFGDYRDKNKDGKLDKDEVKAWIVPDDYDHIEAEAKHLIFESDADRDGKLSREEIMEKHDIFVGSQATDFGEALVNHDEF